MKEGRKEGKVLCSGREAADSMEGIEYVRWSEEEKETKERRRRRYGRRRKWRWRMGRYEDSQNDQSRGNLVRTLIFNLHKEWLERAFKKVWFIVSDNSNVISGWWEAANVVAYTIRASDPRRNETNSEGSISSCWSSQMRPRERYRRNYIESVLFCRRIFYLKLSKKRFQRFNVIFQCRCFRGIVSLIWRTAKEVYG